MNKQTLAAAIIIGLLVLFAFHVLGTAYGLPEGVGFGGQLALGLLVTFLVFMLYQKIKHDRKAFSLENINKSLTTMGFLAIGLILTIGFVIMLLKQTV